MANPFFRIDSWIDEWRRGINEGEKEEQQGSVNFGIFQHWKLMSVCRQGAHCFHSPTVNSSIWFSTHKNKQRAGRKHAERLAVIFGLFFRKRNINSGGSDLPASCAVNFKDGFLLCDPPIYSQSQRCKYIGNKAVWTVRDDIFWQEWESDREKEMLVKQEGKIQHQTDMQDGRQSEHLLFFLMEPPVPTLDILKNSCHVRPLGAL